MVGGSWWWEPIPCKCKKTRVVDERIEIVLFFFSLVLNAAPRRSATTTTTAMYRTEEEEEEEKTFRKTQGGYTIRNKGFLKNRTTDRQIDRWIAYIHYSHRESSLFISFTLSFPSRDDDDYYYYSHSLYIETGTND